MAISKVALLQNGVIRQVATDTDEFIVNTLRVGGSTGTVLTKAILDRLILLQNGTDVDATYHTHDNRYYTETEIGSTAATSGASLVGVNNTPTNYSPAAANVEEHLKAIDSALGAAGSNEFDDSLFRIFDNADNTKKIAFEASAISTGTVRTIIMPDADVDLGLMLKKDGSVALTADWNVGGFKITGLADPTADSDAANKLYVDNAIAGLDTKDAVRAATTAALPANTYNNGSSGVGATLTANANGALPAIDGVTLAVNDRVLVKDEATAANNGIYVVTDLGSATTPWILTRATDADGSPAGEVKGGMSTFVTEGTTNINTVFRLQGTGNKTIGTDPLNFLIYSRAEKITASTGLTKSGLDIQVDPAIAGAGLAFAAGVLSVNVDNATIEIATDTLQLKAGGITDTHISATAAIAWSKMAALAADKVAITDASGVITTTSVATGADLDTLAGGPDSDASALHTHEKIVLKANAGENMPASGLTAVRWGINDGTATETAGAFYKADVTEQSVGASKDPFFVVGVFDAAGETAGTPISVVTKGKLAKASHGFTVGAPIYLGAAGVVQQNPPTTAGEAVVRIGIALDANTLWIDPVVVGVN